MPLEQLMGWVAMITTIVYTGVGLPMQVWTNFRRKSTAGLSRFLIVMMFITSCVWVTYGLVHTPIDWFIVCSNVLGVLCGAMVLCQFMLYPSGSEPHKKGS